MGAYEALVTRGLGFWNRNRVTKRAVSLFVHHVSHRWIHLASQPRLRLVGADHIRPLVAPRGILLVANHRTMWDLYVATSILTGLQDRVRDLYFPVKRQFFYTNPLGLLLNLAVSGGSMWPPMAGGFDRRRRGANAMEELARVLDRPDTLAGIHPEGTRNRAADPMDLLPAKGGVGRLIQACHPDVVVVPIFLRGLSDNLPAELLRNLAPKRARPSIELAFGPVRRAGDYDAEVRPLIVARQVLEEVRRAGVALERSP